MLETKLASGRSVLIKDMSLNDIDNCKDTLKIEFEGGQAKTISNVNKARTKWIRKGLGGGDFNNWEPNGGDVPDNVIKQLSDEEQAELHGLIQDEQSLGEEVPSNSQ